MKSRLRTVCTVLGVLVLYQIVIRVVRKLYHFPAPAFIGAFLDSGLRKAVQPPEQVVRRSGVRDGNRILELGCGSGAYTTTLARAASPGGEVAALDIQRGMLEKLARKLDRPENEDIHNVRLFEGEAYHLPFTSNGFDLVFLNTVLPEIPDRGRALAEIRRVLRPGGTLAVTEFLPDPDYPLRSTTVRWGEQAGFEVDTVLGNAWNYTVRFRK